jgi:CheY-like chemotaxis protein
MRYESLIVDDEELVRTLTHILLKDIGVDEPVQATNGREALALPRSTSADLIISDWSVPEMDGLELVKACKEKPALRDIPFVMSSEQGENADICRLSRQEWTPISSSHSFLSNYRKLLKRYSENTRPNSSQELVYRRKVRATSCQDPSTSEVPCAISADKCR